MLRVFLVCCLAAPVQAADLNFCWTGGSGYTMTGRMQVPDPKMSADLVTEDDVTAFKIAGYHKGRLLGTWDMRAGTPDTTWHLRFDPRSLTFLTGDSFATTRSQGWNADGQVENCGNPGFGFNSGNFAQDICVNGVYIHDSSIDPTTPLAATFQPVTPTCQSAAVMSKSRARPHSD